MRAGDAIGLLHRVAVALERSGVDIGSARVWSLGGSVVHALYVTTQAGEPLPTRRHRDVEAVPASA